MTPFHQAIRFETKVLHHVMLIDKQDTAPKAPLHTVISHLDVK